MSLWSFLRDFGVDTNIEAAEKQLKPILSGIARDLADLPDGLTSRETAAWKRLNERHRTIIESGDTAADKVVALKKLVTQATAVHQRVSALPALAAEGQRLEGVIDTTLGRVDVAIGTIAEVGLKTKVEDRQRALRLEQGAAHDETEVQARDPLIKALAKKAEILEAVAERAKATSDKLVAAKVAIGEGLEAARLRIEVIAEPLAKNPVKALYDTLRASWDKTIALSDPARLDVAIASAEEALKKLTDELGTEEIASTVSVELRRAVGEKYDALKEALAGIDGGKEALEGEAAAIGKSIEALTGAGSAVALNIALREIEPQLDAAIADVAWTRAGADALLARKKALRAQFAGHAAVIAKIEEERIQAPLREHLRALAERRDILFALTDPGEMGTALKALEGEVAEFAKAVESGARTSEEIGPDVARILSWGTPVTLMMTEGFATYPDAARHRLEDLIEKAKPVVAEKDAKAFVRRVKELAPLARQVSEDIRIARAFDDMGGNSGDLKKVLEVIKPIKFAPSKKVLLDELARQEAEFESIKAITDTDRKTKAMAGLTRTSEAFRKTATEIADRLTSLALDEHLLAIQFAMAPRTLNLDKETSQRDTLLDNKPKRLAVADVPTLRGAVEALGDEITDLLRAVELRVIEILDVRKESAELERRCGVVEAIATDLDDGAEKTKLFVDLDRLRRGLADNIGKARSREEARPQIAAYKKFSDEVLQQAKALQLKAKLAEPDGARAVDELIGAMRNRALTDEEELTCRAAIEQRFGKSLTIGPGLKTKKLPQLYALMTMVPVDHVALNDALSDVEFATEPQDQHNYYSPSRKAIAFNAMGEDETPVDYLADDGSVVNPTYYDSTTLHEVGHAVDEKNKLMSGKVGASGSPGVADYGQWASHDLDAVVKAHGEGGFYARFLKGTVKQADLTAFLRAVLNEETLTKPKTTADRLGSLAGVWDALLKDPTVRVCGKITESKQPWYGGKGLAEEARVGDRVFHESYTGAWVSYSFSERAKTGISAYQWRAPAEWFAEIYALYFLYPDKVPEIPVKKWLHGQTPL